MSRVAGSRGGRVGGALSESRHASQTDAGDCRRAGHRRTRCCERGAILRRPGRGVARARSRVQLLLRQRAHPGGGRRPVAAPDGGPARRVRDRRVGDRPGVGAGRDVLRRDARRLRGVPGRLRRADLRQEARDLEVHAARRHGLPRGRVRKAALQGDRRPGEGGGVRLRVRAHQRRHRHRGRLPRVGHGHRPGRDHARGGGGAHAVVQRAPHPGHRGARGGADRDQRAGRRPPGRARDGGLRPQRLLRRLAQGPARRLPPRQELRRRGAGRAPVRGVEPGA